MPLIAIRRCAESTRHRRWRNFDAFDGPANHVLDAICRHGVDAHRGEKVGGERSGERAIEVFNRSRGKSIGSVPKATVEKCGERWRSRAYAPKLSRYERAEILNKTAPKCAPARPRSRA